MYLLRKDLRQTLWPAMLALVLLLAPPAIGITEYITRSGQAAHWGELRPQVLLMVVMGAVASLIAASSIAGVAFARERRERTTELLATLPVARWKVVASKAVAALLVVFVPLLLGTAAFVAVSLTEPGFWDGPADPTLTSIIVMVGAMGLTLFGLGWLLSSLLRSEVLSSAVPLLVLVKVALAIVVWGRPDAGTMSVQHQDAVVISRLIWTFGVLGTLGVVGGTIIALLRRSP